MYGRDGGYSRGGRAAADVRSFFLRGGIPITLGLIIANVVTFFLVHTDIRSPLLEFLAFKTPNWPRIFWTFLTWPVLGAMDPLGLIFSLGWFYTFGGSLERSWGTRVYGAFLASVATIAALGVWVGSQIPGVGDTMLVGLWVLAGIVTVAWALVNRGEVISFWGLPLAAPWLILLGAGLTWYDAGARVIGLFALPACAAAWWYVTRGRSTTYFDGGWSGTHGRRRHTTADSQPNLRFRDFGRETREPLDGSSSRGWSLARWWRERQERKRLERMFRNSGYTDPEDRRRR